MSIYRSAAGRDAVANWCRTELDGWSLPQRRSVVSVGGVDTHLVSAGHGSPTVLVLPGDELHRGAISSPLARSLAARSSVVLVDLPGQPGLSHEFRPPRRGRPNWYGRWLTGLLAEIAEEPVTVVGWSMGAAVALACASPRLERQVLVSPGGVMRLRTPSTALAAGPAGCCGVADGYVHRLLGRRKAALFADLPDSVVELGPGTGANMRYYRRGTTLSAIEPNPHMYPSLRSYARQQGITLDLRGVGAATTGLGDGSVDAVVSTLVLCTVPDQAAALAEVRRVLRPGGRLMLIEHVAARPGSVLERAQRLLRPGWRWAFEGCDLYRHTENALRTAGSRTSISSGTSCARCSGRSATRSQEPPRPNGGSPRDRRTTGRSRSPNRCMRETCPSSRSACGTWSARTWWPGLPRCLRAFLHGDLRPWTPPSPSRSTGSRTR